MWKNIKWLILAVVCFASGVIFTFQWIGTDYGMDLYDLFKRPEVVEKIVEVEIVKVIVVAEDRAIQMINQEYRDALLKISAVNYNGNQPKSTYTSMHAYATKVLEVAKRFAEKINNGE